MCIVSKKCNNFTHLFRLIVYSGAELIAELSQKKIQKQQQIEKTVLEKIKNKMDSIKAAQKRIQGVQPKEPANHHIGKYCFVVFFSHN